MSCGLLVADCKLRWWWCCLVVMLVVVVAVVVLREPGYAMPMAPSQRAKMIRDNRQTWSSDRTPLLSFRFSPHYFFLSFLNFLLFFPLVQFRPGALVVHTHIGI